jgi:putative tryptophan/tyrosine transport system substrate-binding protein
MRRREFIAGLGSTAAWPLAARAQQRAMPVVGYLTNLPRDADAPRSAAFRSGLKEIGYIERENVVIEYRSAESQNNRLPALAAALIERRVAVIATTGGTPVALAAKQLTKTIPIVFQLGADPVGAGLVTSLNRPVGNLTGVTGLGGALVPKRLQLLKELVPAATSFGFLANPTNPAAKADSENAQEAARELGLQLRVLHASTYDEMTTALATLRQLQLGGLVVSPDGFFASQTMPLAALTLRYSVPAIYQYHAFAASGGLICYGSSEIDQLRLVGNYVGRILNGDKPAELPVQQATKVELIINLKTAKALGLTIPETLLATADEVIQ